ncbi:uncharacterized protein P884DRAFT_268973 [Thermothelomyces heterothallicus CBS 202.75]|uniref:uncharacterized protein n=1 Tax=Thermothelomyces heterothallicus CBS 202.75 TaxID=1149848 RepID=UPI003743A202
MATFGQMSSRPFGFLKGMRGTFRKPLGLHSTTLFNPDYQSRVHSGQSPKLTERGKTREAQSRPICMLRNSSSCITRAGHWVLSGPSFTLVMFVGATVFGSNRLKDAQVCKVKN